MCRLSSRRVATAIATAVLAIGCEADPPVAKISVYGSLTDPEDLAGLVLRIGHTELTAADFGEDRTVWMRFPDSGELQVALRLEQSGKVAAEGSVALTMRKDHAWVLRISRGVESHEPCVACQYPIGFPIAEWARTEPGERLWFSADGFPRHEEGVVY